jgi:hypothetical protein
MSYSSRRGAVDDHAGEKRWEVSCLEFVALLVSKAGGANGVLHLHFPNGAAANDR